MPKKKASSSDSDSGPDDRSPAPAAKKTKPDGPKSTKADDPGGHWTLEKLLQVNINEFRGRKSADIRHFYEKDGKILPGKKGISLSATQWRRLLEISSEVTAALENQ